MLCALIYNLLIILCFIGFRESTFADIHQKNSCQVTVSQEIPFRETPCGETLYKKTEIKGNPKYNPTSTKKGFEEEVLKLTRESLKMVEALKEDQDFQSLLSELRTQAPTALSLPKSIEKEGQGDLYIFVSFSMGEKALLNLAKEAKEFGATLVLRGFKERSYKKTAFALKNIIEKTGQGFLIDPELYTLFNITSVPTYVFTKPLLPAAELRISTPIHDRLQGHVSIRHTLETFAKSGDFRLEAKLMLKKSEKQ